MFTLLLSLSHCYFCKQTILVAKNIPENFEGPLGDGDRLCINSTLPYLAVAFQQTTLLKVRYYSLDPSSSKVKTAGHFFIPSEIAAVGFGKTIGHVEVQALIPGTVSLSTFAFPTECARNRYLTTVKDDEFHLANRLGLGQFADEITDAACIWSPHPRTAIIGAVNADSRDSIQVCGETSCTSPWANGPDDPQGRIEFTSIEYLRIAANRPDFVETWQVELSVKQLGNFLGAAGKFDDDSDVDTVPLEKRGDKAAHPDLADEVVPLEATAPAAAPVLVRQIVGPPQERARTRGFRTILAVLQIICLTVIIVGVIVCIILVISSRSIRDDAQSGLLGSGPQATGTLGRFAGYLPYAMPWAGGVPQYGGLYQPPAGFAYAPPAGGGAGFPAAQFPQTTEEPITTPQQRGNT